MNAFLWTLISLWTFSCICKLILLGTETAPKPETPAGVALQVLVNAGFIGWASYLLIRGNV